MADERTDATDPTDADETPDPATANGGDAAGANGGGATDDPADGAAREEGFDLRGIVRQLTAPMIESLDTRLRDQVEAHVDELLTVKLDAAIADRLATVDRAIADLSRSIEALDRRIASLERAGDTED